MERLYAISGQLATEGWLPAALTHPFMVRATLAALLLAPLLGCVGPLVVAKRLAFFSTALGHAALTGVALGVLLGEDPSGALAGQLGFCLVAALGLTYLRLNSRLSSDALIGVFLSFSLGTGVCLLTLATRRFDIHQIEGAMFGNLVTVTERDLVLLVVAGALALPVLFGTYNRLVLASVDPALARTWGVPVRKLEYAFMVVLTLVVVVALQLAGFLLVEGLVVVPAAAARNLAGSLRAQVVGSTLVALVASLAGLALSYLFPVPTGAALSVALAALFALTWVLGRLLPGRR